MPPFRRLILALAAAGMPLAVFGQHDMHAPSSDPPAKAAKPPADTRQAVKFPKALREHTLANMRDHLLALQQIQESLARQEFDAAAAIAEQRLGMSAMKLHGAHEVGKFMPPGMQQAGAAMHRSASRFALAAQDAGATGDLGPALDALSQITAQCVACHAGYRVK